MSEEKIKQDVVDEEISEPTEATKEQSILIIVINAYKRILKILNAVLIKKKNSWQVLLRAMS